MCTTAWHQAWAPSASCSVMLLLCLGAVAFSNLAILIYAAGVSHLQKLNREEHAAAFQVTAVTCDCPLLLAGMHS
jgi:hypothetical protein